jgi:hypothetical protein
MAYRELGMWEVLDVLRRVQRGETKSGIERTTGRSRKTIHRYVKTAAKLGWAPGVEGRDLLRIKRTPTFAHLPSGSSSSLPSGRRGSIPRRPDGLHPGLRLAAAARSSSRSR